VILRPITESEYGTFQISEITSHTRCLGGVVSAISYYTPQATEGLALVVASEHLSDVERFVPDRVHVARTNNKQVRLWRISAFLNLSSLKGREAGPMIRHTRLRYQCHLMLISHEKHPLASCSSCMRQLFPRFQHLLSDILDPGSASSLERRESI